MINYRRFIGSQVAAVVEDVSLFRIKYFREYPYLYEGSMEYEKQYFDEFIKDSKAFVEIVENNEGTIVGIATGIPLSSDVSILKDTQALFHSQGHDCSKYYYIGEIIISPDYRNQKIARQLLDNVENYAKEQNFQKGTLATVIREIDDPRTPKFYKASDDVWERYGYQKSNLIFEYSWPTINLCGEVEDLQNPMVFWIKQYL